MAIESVTTIMIGLVGIFVGWLLGFATEEWRRCRRLKLYRRVIYEELRDVHSAIKTRTGGLEQTIKAYLAGKPDAHAPTTINSPAFNRWFAETALEFTESERLALTHIYSQLEGLNWNFGVIRENWEINTEDSTVNKENLRRMIQMTEGAYRNLRTLDVMVQMLLRDKERYNIRMPERAQRLDEISSEIDKELRRWRKEAEAAAEIESPK